jgi:hypothetical protein
VFRDKIFRLRKNGLRDLGLQLAEAVRKASEKDFPDDAGKWGGRVRGLFDEEDPGADGIIVRARPFQDGPAGPSEMEALDEEMTAAGIRRGIIFAAAGFTTEALACGPALSGRIRAMDAEATAELMYRHGEGTVADLEVEYKVPDRTFLDSLDAGWES